MCDPNDMLMYDHLKFYVLFTEAGYGWLWSKEEKKVDFNVTVITRAESESQKPDWVIMSTGSSFCQQMQEKNLWNVPKQENWNIVAHSRPWSAIYHKDFTNLDAF